MLFLVGWGIDVMSQGEYCSSALVSTIIYLVRMAEGNFSMVEEPDYDESSGTSSCLSLQYSSHFIKDSINTSDVDKEKSTLFCSVFV